MAKHLSSTKHSIARIEKKRTAASKGGSKGNSLDMLGLKLKPMKKKTKKKKDAKAASGRPWSADHSRVRNSRPRSRGKARPGTASGRSRSKGRDQGKRGAGSAYSLLRSSNIKELSSSLGKHSKNKVYVTSGIGTSPEKKHTVVKRKAFKEKCVMLLRLWQELKIPKRDREFFFGAYCGEVSSANMARVESQLKLVLQHRETTINVLKQIASREKHIDILKMKLADVRNTSPNEVCDLLLNLRQATLEVVMAIVRWRSFLWRPQPFMWERTNYLLKIGSDLRFTMPEMSSEGTMLFHTFDLNIVDPICLVAESAGNSQNQSNLDIGGGTSSAAAKLQVHADEISPLEAARKVVIAEKTMQEELKMEHERLLISGYYIPTLKWSPEEDPMALSSGARADEPKRHKDDGCPEIDDGIEYDDNTDDDFEKQLEIHIKAAENGTAADARVILEETRDICGKAYLVRVMESASAATVAFCIFREGSSDAFALQAKVKYERYSRQRKRSRCRRASRQDCWHDEDS